MIKRTVSGSTKILDDVTGATLRLDWFVCLDRALAQFPLWWCQVNGVQSSYCNDFETKVELERVVITVLLGTAPVP